MSEAWLKGMFMFGVGPLPFTRCWGPAAERNLLTAELETECWASMGLGLDPMRQFLKLDVP